ncbi:acetolactate synthase AlsS [Brochothrix thermosphacta]|uniref:Acetolactate synthase AlsS n=1 Tax=Brochothrix thermosphacta TaxID=2756 RepID=A0A1D2LI52_BROTH|nr:acetolactate synthase AlsS [Brochothrix thermosphacta]ATF26905.1 acetolactate synthase AlsS [Brochothrix thermosphacta]ATH86262.1 acetolactate synthase AlsS [Brochothrix thermosphacta]MPQ27844.1 acetolactate synthase AlsS [Brochothrix thermosphacta]ODJ67728.1 acetolactate synthase [Brochothrix thermosphacta]ODJ69480.1 acetolactate synthase [Brochothrix thermosphacta]
MIVMTKEIKPVSTGADLFVDTLINNKVDYVFGIPGAKIDKAFDVLAERGPEVIVCRHEQNATLIAQGVGRITGKPGVVLVTSGPGVTNLATGLVTANAESDPVLAVGGNVTRKDSLKRTHQSMDNAGFMKHVTKSSVEVLDAEAIPEAMTNAYREAMMGRPGATFVSIPQDVISAKDVHAAAIPAVSAPHLGSASKKDVEKLVERLSEAKLPVFLLGMRASSVEATAAIRDFLTKHPMPVVETFQGSGIISRKLENNFYGRVGLFRNQPGDVLLNKADLVITIGYDPIEYDPITWNPDNDSTIIHLDTVPADIDHNYQPVTELVGDITETLELVTEKLSRLNFGEEAQAILKNVRDMQNNRPIKAPALEDQTRVHPVTLVNTLQKMITDDMTVTVDVGSIYIYMARLFRSYEPRRLLFSNGMQTLGVALPWGIAASLVRPTEKVISMSGDGGFLFSGQELETAVRLKSNLVHLVWNDGTYDMVAFQQQKKYGKDAAVKLGPVDFAMYAESMGAKGLRVDKVSDLEAVLSEALATEGPVVVDIPVDYRDNIKLANIVMMDTMN